MKTWLEKYASKIFPEKGTGIHKTSLSKVSWTKNPEKIVPISRGTSESDLVELALQAGFEDAVRIVHTPNKDYLGTLDKDDLARIGWKRQAGNTLDISPLAATGDKKKSA